ncbi:hypothetical protein, partial [Haemophilus influenzae]|uniref:hypothetical protein n=1 Tax=Haemophilus influenzae TaxID=727 RepID=UPI0019544C8E
IVVDPGPAAHLCLMAHMVAMPGRHDRDGSGRRLGKEAMAVGRGHVGIVGEGWKRQGERGKASGASKVVAKSSFFMSRLQVGGLAGRDTRRPG